MSIQHFRTKIKKEGGGGKKRAMETLVFCAILVFVGVGSFGAGILAERARNAPENASGAPSNSVIIAPDMDYFNNRNSIGVQTSRGAYFASRNGISYYPQGCQAGDRIADKNKIYFMSTHEAELAGFKQSASCDF